MSKKVLSPRELPIAGAEREAAAAPHAAEEGIEAARRHQQDFLDLAHEGLGLVRRVRRQLLRLGRLLLGNHLRARRLARRRRGERHEQTHEQPGASARSGLKPSTSRGHRAQVRHAGMKHASPISTDGATPEWPGHTRNSRIFHGNVTGGCATGGATTPLCRRPQRNSGWTGLPGGPPRRDGGVVRPRDPWDQAVVGKGGITSKGAFSPVFTGYS